MGRVGKFVSKVLAKNKLGAGCKNGIGVCE